jgi:hypothetical protein
VKYWLIYTWHRLCNEFCQLVTLPLSEKHVVGEALGKLKLDPTLRKLIEEQEQKEHANNG